MSFVNVVSRAPCARRLAAAGAMLTAVVGLSGPAAHAAPVSFQGQVASGAFQLSWPVEVAAGQVGSLIGSVASSAYDSTVLVPVTLGNTVVNVPLTLHFDALSFTRIRLGAWQDDTPADGFSFTALPSGAYTLTVEGTSATGGVYAGSYSLSQLPDSVTQVPEPATAALGLTALALMAWRGRRAAPRALK